MSKVIDNKPFDDDYGIIHCSEGIDLMPCNVELSGIESYLFTVMSRECIIPLKVIGTINVRLLADLSVSIRYSGTVCQHINDWIWKADSFFPWRLSALFFWIDFVQNMSIRICANKTKNRTHCFGKIIWMRGDEKTWKNTAMYGYPHSIRMKNGRW